MRNIRISFFQKLKEKISAQKPAGETANGGGADPPPFEIDSVNTPASLGVTPRFVLQHNAISRSIQNLSATAKKLTAVAMSLLPADLSSLTASFSYIEFCKAIGYTTGGAEYECFKKAVKECMDCKISIELESPKPGKKIWKQYTWIIYSEINEASGLCVMKFSPELAKVLLEMKRVYARINLQDIGKLQSKYGLRYFEMSKSYESLAGKDGNGRDRWYFERTISELRQLLAIRPDVYPRTDNFKKRVVEQPVKEINEAGIGLEIKTEGIKRGRSLEGIRFTCAKTARTAPGKRKRPETAPPPVERPEFNAETAASRNAKELQHLQELYPEDFARLYAVEMAKKTDWMPADSAFKKQAAMISACKALRERHGVVK
jgi:plasmid replication initiation protein